MRMLLFTSTQARVMGTYGVLNLKSSLLIDTGHLFGCLRSFARRYVQGRTRGMRKRCALQRSAMTKNIAELRMETGTWVFNEGKR